MSWDSARWNTAPAMLLHRGADARPWASMLASSGWKSGVMTNAGLDLALHLAAAAHDFFENY